MIDKQKLFVSVRSRDHGDLGMMSLDDFIKGVTTEISERRLDSFFDPTDKTLKREEE